MTKEASDLEMSLTFHELMVDSLIMEDPGIQKCGFPNFLRKIFKGNTLNMVFMQNRNQTLGFRPDAFKIDNEQQEIFLYEVEDSHPLTIRKIAIIINLFWILDDIGWDLHLLLIDRYTFDEKEVDLRTWSPPMDQYQRGLAE